MNFVLAVVAAIYYSGWGEVYVKNWSGRTAREDSVNLVIKENFAKLDLKMKEIAYADSVRGIIEAVYIDLALSNGVKAYNVLHQLLNKTGNERSSVFVAAGAFDTLSIDKPAYGTFLAEIYMPEQEAFLPDWDNTYLPSGLKEFLMRTMKEKGVVTVKDIDKDTVLSEPITFQYLKNRNVKSMMACYIGRSPTNARYYFLLSFYHEDYLEEGNISRDVFYTHNACINIRRLFGLIESKK